MSLETSYEVQEMLRDDGVQTFRAKEKSTGRSLELHLFPPFGRPENKLLFERVKGLPLETRRKFLDIGVDGSTPYVVTDPLPAGRTFKVWVEEVIGGVQKASFATTAPITPPPSAAALPEDGVQILQAGQWRTGTPIPDSLVSKPAAPPPPPPLPPAPPPSEFSWVPSDDRTVMMKMPLDTPAKVAPPPSPIAAAPPQPPPPPPAPVPAPGEFTALFQAPDLFGTKAPEAAPTVGEFTGIFQSRKPAADLEGFGQAPPPSAAPFTPPPPAIPQTPPPQEAGEFTRMFQAPNLTQPPAPAATSSTPPYIPPPAAPPTPPAPSQNPFFRQPEPEQSSEFTKFFESPLKPMSSQPQPQAAAFEPPPPPPPTPRRAGEFTDIFGAPSIPSTGGFPERFQAPPLAPPASQGHVSATGIFTPGAWSQPQAQPTFGSGPSEYTKMMSAPAVPTLGQAPVYAQAPAPVAPKKSNLPIFIAVGVAVLLVIAIAVFLLMHGAASAVTTPAAK